MIANIILIGLSYLTFLFIGFMPIIKERNYTTGYRTPRSMKSQELWDFAQKKTKKVALILGQLYLLTNLVVLYVLNNFVEINENYTFILIVIPLMILFFIILIIWVEKSLAKYEKELNLTKKQED
ncbi:MAG: SdpI family protein [Chitinophagales bacterium]|nr:SdpI family protein [Bacteroidota bacterium]